MEQVNQPAQGGGGRPSDSFIEKKCNYNTAVDGNCFKMLL